MKYSDDYHRLLLFSLLGQLGAGISKKQRHVHCAVVTMHTWEVRHRLQHAALPGAGAKHRGSLTTRLGTTFMYHVFVFLYASKSMSIKYDIYFYCGIIQKKLSFSLAEIHLSLLI